MEILRPIAGDAAAGVLRRQAAVGQVNRFQLAVAVLYAVAIERGAGRPGLAPLAPCDRDGIPPLRIARAGMPSLPPRLPIWEGKLRKL